MPNPVPHDSDLHAECGAPYYIERAVYQAALDQLATLEARVAALTAEATKHDDWIREKLDAIDRLHLVNHDLSEKNAALTAAVEAMLEALYESRTVDPVTFRVLRAALDAARRPTP